MRRISSASLDASAFTTLPRLEDIPLATDASESAVDVNTEFSSADSTGAPRRDTVRAITPFVEERSVCATSFARKHRNKTDATADVQNLLHILEGAMCDQRYTV